MHSRVKDAAVVIVGKVAVSSIVLGSGFRAVSDDDYARIVIAQRFAESPSLDPSGTSWLPFPFWLNGGAMIVLGSSVEVARGLALVLGVAASFAVWLSLRWLGAGRLGAVVGAVAASIFPYSAWLGVAAVPELPTAALCLLAAASLRRDGSARLWGAVAVLVACLSRYEAWPVAAVFAAFCLRSARVHGLATIVALAGPCGWLAHGALSHGSAFFFVRRVSEYRRAVGAGNQETWSALSGFPSMLVRCEPELIAFVVVAVGAAVALGGSSVLRRHARVICVFGAVLVFLVAGDLRDGAPTHHGERALLGIWLGLAALAGDAFGEAWGRARGPIGALLLAVPGLAIAPMTAIVRPWYSARDAFVDRTLEVEMGRAARHAAGPSGRLLIDSRDFGFYAAMAGFGSPSRSATLDDRDPRRPRAPDPFSTPAALRARLDHEQADWLLVEAEHAPSAAHFGPVERDGGRLVLVKVRPR